MKHKIIGYFIDHEKEISPGNIFIAIDEVIDLNGNITVYSPIGQHGTASRSYVKKCKQITKEEYIKHSKGIYTPEDYLK